MNIKVKHNGVFEDVVIKGLNGADGASAYEIAKKQGYPGTEEEWIASLKGKDATASISVNATVATSAWAASSTYSGYQYKATVAVSGVTANNNIMVGIAATATAEQEEACADAGVQCKGQATNQIILYAKTIPTISLPISVMIFG